MLKSRGISLVMTGLLLAGLVVCQMGGCSSGFSLLPFASITAVQLFDQPDFTVAFSIDNAVSNPSAVTKVNWVFGDGSGFVEGAPNRTTITYRYSSTGNFQVTAYIFGSQGLAEQISGNVNVVPSGNPPPGPGDTELPAQISGGNPADGAQNVPVTTTLTWTAGARATSHDVYLGVDQSAVELANDADAVNFKGNQTTTSYDPGGLLPNTTYYWRIDEVNSVGITKGTVRSFKTAAAPAKAKSPVPQNGSMNARVDQILNWTAGTGTTSHDVYFGDDMMAVTDATRDTADIFKGNQSGTNFDPEDESATQEGELLGSTTYYWRIDEVGPGGTTTGDVWTFTTRAPPPMITNPVPADLDIDVDIDVVLTWTAAASIESFDVYLGVDPVDVTLADRNSPEFQGNQTSKNFTPGTLLADTDYYWRIDTRGPGGTTMGLVLTFRTADIPAQAVLTAPAHQSQDQDVEVSLQWTPGAGGGPLSGFQVYLSTTQSQVVNRNAAARVATLGAGATNFTPTSPLASNTDHFWTVDATGPGGRREGPIFRFRTGTLPNQASMPMPANGATAVAPDVMLAWTAGTGTLSHNVYFGTNSNTVTNADEDDAEFRGNQLLGVETFSPPAGVPSALAANTQYFWRIDELGTGGTRKGVTWNFRTGPGKAINPNPNDGANNTAGTSNLTWTAGSGASTHDVYLGTDLGIVTNATPLTVGVFRGNQASTTFDPPGTMPANTTHYWRIDSVAADGITKTTGDVWTFTTELGKATNPNPSNNATGIALDAILEWTAGAGADMHDVYFGTSLAAVTNATTADPEYRGQQADTLFDPTMVMAIMADTQYFWRIDTVAVGGAPVRKGDTWRYRTLAPPAQVSGPNPVNGATGVATNTSLTWASADGATTYDVYFGTSLVNVTNATTADPEFQGNQSSRVFTPGALANNTQYFWRIDSKNAAGTTTGSVFSFTTVP